MSLFFSKMKDADEISLLIERNRIIKERIEINNEEIKELKKRFKAIHLDKYEDYEKRHFE